MRACCDRAGHTNWRCRSRRGAAWCREGRRLSRLSLALRKARRWRWLRAFVQLSEEARPRLSPVCDCSRRAKTKMRTAERTASFARGRLLLHEVCQFVQLGRCHTQCLRRVLTNGWDDFVVQILDKLGGLLLDSFRGVAYGFVHARRCVLDLAVEIVHESFGPRAENCRTWQIHHYFLAGTSGSTRDFEGKQAFNRKVRKGRKVERRLSKRHKVVRLEQRELQSRSAHEAQRSDGSTGSS